MVEHITVDFLCGHGAAAQAKRSATPCNIYYPAGSQGSDIPEAHCILRFKNVSEVLFESLNGRELLEYFGIDREHYVSHQEIG